MSRCDRCGAQVQVGDWPFCKGDPKDHENGGSYGFSPFEPYVDPNILPNGKDVGYNRHLGRMVTGTLIESREQRKRIMRENNIEWAGRTVDTGGREF